MQPNRRRTSYAATVIMLLMLGLAWLLFAPTIIGGRVSYVIVNGNSMEPGMRRGDLVLVRRAVRYDVGTVVTYQHPTIGAVIHRIVDRDGDRFVLQGDNNGWLDSYHPTAAEIAGAQWLHIPLVGTAIAQVRSPLGLLLLGVIAAGALIVTAPRPRPQPVEPRPARRPPYPARPGQPPALDTASRDAAATLALIVVACLILVIYAFTRPDQRPVTVDLPYQQTGAFSYTAEAPPGIYDAAVVMTGDPVFREITDRVSVTFDYRFSASAVADVGGQWSLLALVSNSNGWQRTVPLSGPVEFSGESFTATGELDLAAIQLMIDSVVAQTGVRHDVNTIVIRPELELTGSVAGQPLHDTFAPGLVFRLDDQQLRLVDGGATDPAVLTPSQTGLLALPGSEPNSVTLLGWELSLSHVRMLAVGGLALAEVLLLLLLVQLHLSRRAGRAEPASAATGVQVIEVSSLGLSDARRVVTIASFDDLASLAARADSPVLSRKGGRVQRFVVHIGDISYQYVAGISSEAHAPGGAQA